MAWTLCTSGEAITKAGVNATSKITASGAILDPISDQVEGFISAATRYNWSGAYSGLNADVRNVLSEVASNLAGAYLIAYDMSGYTLVSEAQSMINVLRDGALRGLSVLRDKKTQDFLNAA